MSYKRRIILINRNFQLRFSIYVCSFIFALSIMYPWIIYNLFDFIVRYLAVDPNGPVLGYLHAKREEIIWLLIVMQLLFTLVTFSISIFMSHRIAGPVVKFQQFLQKFKRGDFSQKFTLRRYDYFQELADDYNELAASLKSRSDQVQSHIEKAMLTADTSSKEELSKALALLRGSQAESKS